jgi:hypothetical protein
MVIGSFIMVPCETVLETLLDKAIVECGLRKTLAEYGISGNETVRLELITENGTNISCQVPENNARTLDEISLAPIAELREKIKDFLNDGQEKLDLVEEIEKHKTPSSSFTLALNIGSTVSEKAEMPKVKLLFSFGTECPCSNPRYRCCTF